MSLNEDNIVFGGWVGQANEAKRLASRNSCVCVPAYDLSGRPILLFVYPLPSLNDDAFKLRFVPSFPLHLIPICLNFLPGLLIPKNGSIQLPTPSHVTHTLGVKKFSIYTTMKDKPKSNFAKITVRYLGENHN